MIRSLIILVLSLSCKDNNSFNNGEKRLLDIVTAETICTVGAADSIVDGVYFSLIEEIPEFGDGAEYLLKYIKDNAEHPKSAIDDNLEGRVYIQFVINKDRSVSNEPRAPLARATDISLIW